MDKASKYSEIRDKILPGDVIAFGGNGVVSNTIKLATGSDVSHVGIVPYVSSIEALRVVFLIESTSLADGFSGVDIRRLSTRVETYDGDVWWYPLTDTARRKLQAPASFIDLNAFLIRQRGKEYDTPQAILSAIDFVPDSPEDLSRLFCSELVSAALEVAGIIDNVNASEQTPADVCGFGCFGERVKIQK